jgi:hypothetical protein
MPRHRSSGPPPMQCSQQPAGEGAHRNAGFFQCPTLIGYRESGTRLFEAELVQAYFLRVDSANRRGHSAIGPLEIKPDTPDPAMGHRLHQPDRALCILDLRLLCAGDGRPRDWHIKLTASSCPRSSVDRATAS